MEPVFRMHTLAAGHGDCLWIDFGDPDAPKRILVDAGTQGTFPELKRAMECVRAGVPSHELFVVTHVDQDHIGGALALMADEEIAAQFKQVWFNGWKHLQQASGMQSLGAVMGERLSGALELTPHKWNAAFSHGPVMRDTSSAAIPPLPVGGATVTVLSPTAKELVKLRDQWAAEVRAAGLIPGVPPKKPALAKPGMQALGPRNIRRLADTPVDIDTAEANGSSIAMLIEFEGKRILLGADAHAPVLLAGVRHIQPVGRLPVDVFKVPHHGSAANVTDELLDAIEPKTIVFSSNGARFKHPDEIAVARVVRAYEGKGVTLVFNYETKFNRMWKSKSLQKKWGYLTRYGRNDEGVTVEVR
ncbi:ComEC/Rec2 family competence protein [Burkholderia vietnamiensis]|uniref:ComEC/Rec2 family competence protein n=1 Tax=Burkholderia vietnamiensis TaxID=60552 RepID=UPI000AC1137B|nr:hypothetical protein [Burkholderia vietnamiensis]